MDNAQADTGIVMADSIDAPRGVSTPCFVVLEERVLHNLRKTRDAAGGAGRLMPHVKTHRAPWIVELLLGEGVRAFKAATTREVEMVLEAGAPRVLWAYPTVNGEHVRRLVGAARRFEGARVEALVDSAPGLEIWTRALKEAPLNVALRVDLDPGLGRTGAAIGRPALDLAKALEESGRFGGWHLYDGHLKGSRADRTGEVMALAKKVECLLEARRREGVAGDVVAGGSYTFDIWPGSLVRYVSPGSWTYSSDQHDIELGELGWQPAAFVLATVISTRDGAATLDAGSKAISPDKPMAERFRWPGQIRLMNEEHTVVEARGLAPGDRVLLMPRHACTTAYLYDRALVKTRGGTWEYRGQLGGSR